MGKDEIGDEEGGDAAAFVLRVVPILLSDVLAAQGQCKRLPPAPERRERDPAHTDDGRREQHGRILVGLLLVSPVHPVFEIGGEGAQLVGGKRQVRIGPDPGGGGPCGGELDSPAPAPAHVLLDRIPGIAQLAGLQEHIPVFHQIDIRRSGETLPGELVPRLDVQHGFGPDRDHLPLDVFLDVALAGLAVADGGGSVQLMGAEFGGNARAGIEEIPFLVIVDRHRTRLVVPAYEGVADVVKDSKTIAAIYWYKSKILKI